MSHVGDPNGRAPRIVTAIRTAASVRSRSVALLTTGALVLPVLLTGCGSDSGTPVGAAPQDIAVAERPHVADGGTLKWAVDAMPETLNTFQADADTATQRVAQAVLPALFTLDERGRPQRNADYLESAEVVTREPKQVVLYKLNQKAVWSDGREIGAPDFVAQWRALSGKDSAYWTARNAGYERIEKIEKGANDLEVKVTFAKPYADWRSLFSPLYPKDITGTPDAFNDGARTKLKATAGAFRLKEADRAKGVVTLERNPRWWGHPAKLDTLVLQAVPRDKRAAALAAGTVDMAEIDRADADRITLAERDQGKAVTHGPAAAITPASALRSWAIAHSGEEEKAEAEQEARKESRAAVETYAKEQAGLRGFAIRKTLEPAYTQLALNGASGPLADERVRRAIARALNRRELAEEVLKPLGLPATPPGSHLALAGQDAYTDSSDALGSHDEKEARALLADAGWTPEGARMKPKQVPAKAGGEADGEDSDDGKRLAATTHPATGNHPNDEGTYIVGDDKPGSAGPGTYGLTPARSAAVQSAALFKQARIFDTEPAEQGKKAADKNTKTEARPKGGAPGAYAPKGTAAPAPQGGPLGKDGKPLTLRFVLPSGPGSQALRTIGDRIAAELKSVGINTEIVKVADDSYFKDHIASGDFDLALYSWPGTAYPATDDRPIFAKPEPAADGSLLVEQNYSRVGTDHIDQLFEQAAAELDEDEARDLVQKADARIWAAAGSIPLYQRPQLVAVKPNVANAGAFGFGTPHFQDIGFKKPETAPDATKNTKKQKENSKK
ncbi:ABC transporter family substrate-binding protein [Streptomyces mauvecolor]|uniref:ABC transporter family substrate-binding protein n=1 Tax=Streptomyces mauvecolor TaxID=58345 RepID=A0ABV9URT5_9ACTN